MVLEQDRAPSLTFETGAAKSGTVPPNFGRGKRQERLVVENEEDFLW